MDADAMRIPIKVFLSSGEPIQSNLCYTTEGPKLFNADDSEFELIAHNIDFSILDAALCHSISVTQNDRIEFAATIYTRKLRRDLGSQDDLYPPSTKKWIALLSHEGDDATLTIQRIKNDSRYLLSVLENATGKLTRLHSINSYEVLILQFESDWELYSRLFASQKRATADIMATTHIQAKSKPLTTDESLIASIET